MGYGHILIYDVACDTIVLECISLYVSHGVVSVLICAVTASAAVPHYSAEVPRPAATANHVVHKLSFASRFTYLTQYAAPHRSMDVGRAPLLSLKYESWLLKLI